MARIVCLANSFKEGGRCIAGIDIDTGKWVRPVSPNRIITAKISNIDGKEPEILDIIEIPLEDQGPDFGCQPENRLLKNGKWKKVGRMEPRQLLKFCDFDPVILHNNHDHVLYADFQSLPREKWKSLQLIRKQNISFQVGSKGEWRVCFFDGKNRLLKLKTTDEVLLNKLRKKENISSDCIMTISLTGPWRSGENWPMTCWKLVAGFIELWRC